MKKPSGNDSIHNPLTDNLNDKLGPQYIQPRSRYTNQVPSLVIEPKKPENEVSGLSGLRINRSSSNLPTLNNSSSNSHTNLHGLNNAALTSSVGSGAAKARSALSRNFASFTVHGNNSNSSVTIAEEEQDDDSNEKKKEVKHTKEDTQAEAESYNEKLDDWEHNFNDMIHGRGETKLAPFGGFSRPNLECGGLFNQENIFEKAPWKVVLTDKGNGSLTKAVKLSVEAGTIHKRKWVGTLSMPSDVVPEHIIKDIAKTLNEEYHSNVVFPNDLTFQGHYKSFCKQILWPTLHYQIPDDPKSKAFEDHSWGHYKLLNQLVADKVVEAYKQEQKDLKPDDPENIIWVHDYHLFLVPKMIREKLPNAKIGFFLHVSFPSSEVFRCFAQRKALLRGMLGANSIAFQTEEYGRHFLQTCNRLLLADTNEFGVTYDGNFTSVTTTPVGIDANSLSDLLVSEEVQEWRKLIRERWGNQHLIVNRDKLDKLRGIKQKLLAYERFLRKYPKYVDSTVLIQICIGSSHDPDYDNEVMAIVGRINSLPENISVSQPVVLLQKDIEFEQYLALQCEADVFVVSSMREGMNLTCHEFIIATTEKKSPLMLSEFTGSSPLLYNNGNGALLLNPWDIKEFSELFYKALTMEPNEKLERWRNCLDTVVTHDSKHWVTTCLNHIAEAWELNQRRNSSTLVPLTRQIFEEYYSSTKANGKRLFFLNLETPSAISTNSKSDLSKAAVGVSDPSKNVFSEPIKISRLLSDLLADNNNQLYIMSYMRRRDLDALFRTIPNVGLIAENGGYIKLVGSQNWLSIVDEADIQNWLPQVTQLFESKVERLPGSHCEVEDCTVRFHPGHSIKDDRERSLDVMGDTIQYVNDVFEEKDGVHATLIKNVVVVQQNQLALKALKFIVSYYLQSKEVLQSDSLIEEYQVKPIPGSVPSTPVAEHHDDGAILTPATPYTSPVPISDASKSPPSSRALISSVFSSGGSTAIDEQGFDFVNDLKKSGKIPNALTVTVLGTDIDVRTSAHYSVAGKNELLSVLSNTET